MVDKIDIKRKISDYFVSLILFIGFFILYFKYLSRDFNFDGLVFAYIVEQPTKLNIFHANHLLYNYFGLKLYRLAINLGFTGRAVYFLAIMNAFLGALGIALFYLLVKKITQSKQSLLISLLLGVSYTYWYFSVEVQVYQLASVVLLILLWLVLTMQKEKKLNTNHVLIISLVHTVTVLGHILCILLTPVLVIFIYKNSPNKKFKNISIYGLILLILLGASLSLVAFKYLDFKNLQALWAWSLGNAFAYQTYQKLSYWCFDWSHIWKGFVEGTINSFFAPASGKIWSLLRYLILAVLFIFGVAIFKNRKLIWTKEKDHIMLAVGWLVIFSLFLAIWSPGHIGYRLFLLPVFYFLILILLEIISSNRLFINFVMMVVLVLMFMNNFNSIYPRSLWQNNQIYLKTLFLQKNIKQKDFLIIGGNGFDFMMGRVYLPYFTNLAGTSLYDYFYQPQSRDFSDLKRTVSDYWKRGRQVYILSEIIEDIKGKKNLEDNFGLPRGTIDHFLNSYQIKSYKKYADDFIIYKLLPKRPLKKSLEYE